MIILFKYCTDVENCESFRDFSFIYILVLCSCDAWLNDKKIICILNALIKNHI